MSGSCVLHKTVYICLEFSPACCNKHWVGWDLRGQNWWGHWHGEHCAGTFYKLSDQEEEADEALNNYRELTIVGTSCFGIQNCSAIWRSTQWGKSSPANFCGHQEHSFLTQMLDLLLKNKEGRNECEGKGQPWHQWLQDLRIKTPREIRKTNSRIKILGFRRTEFVLFGKLVCQDLSGTCNGGNGDQEGALKLKENMHAEQKLVHLVSWNSSRQRSSLADPAALLWTQTPKRRAGKIETGMSHPGVREWSSTLKQWPRETLTSPSIEIFTTEQDKILSNVI